jgi:hypothetical protein
MAASFGPDVIGWLRLVIGVGLALPKKPRPTQRKTPKPKSKVATTDWKDVIKKAVAKKHPNAGWPE